MAVPPCAGPPRVPSREMRPAACDGRRPGSAPARPIRRPAGSARPPVAGPAGDGASVTCARLSRTLRAAARRGAKGHEDLAVAHHLRPGCSAQRTHPLAGEGRGHELVERSWGVLTPGTNMSQPRLAGAAFSAPRWSTPRCSTGSSSAASSYTAPATTTACVPTTPRTGGRPPAVATEDLDGRRQHDDNHRAAALPPSARYYSGASGGPLPPPGTRRDSTVCLLLPVLPDPLPRRTVVPRRQPALHPCGPLGGLCLHGEEPVAFADPRDTSAAGRQALTSPPPGVRNLDERPWRISLRARARIT